MRAAFKFDGKDFVRAAKAVKDGTRKDGADIINKGSGAACQGAAKAQKTVRPSKIEAELLADRRAYKLINSRPNPPRRSEILAEVVKLINIRKRSSGYVKLGFMLAGKAFGKFLQVKAGKGWAKESKGTKATPGPKPAAMILNAAPGAEEVGAPALQDGIEAGARDILKYGQNVVAKRLREASGKGGKR